MSDQLYTALLVFVGTCLSIAASVYIQQWVQTRKEKREKEQQTVPDLTGKADFAQTLQEVTDKLAADYLESKNQIETQRLDYELKLRDQAARYEQKIVDQAAKYDARLDEQDQKIKAFLEYDERIEVIVTGWPRKTKSAKVETVKSVEVIK